MRNAPRPVLAPLAHGPYTHLHRESIGNSFEQIRACEASVSGVRVPRDVVESVDQGAPGPGAPCAGQRRLAKLQRASFTVGGLPCFAQGVIPTRSSSSSRSGTQRRAVPAAWSNSSPWQRQTARGALALAHGGPAGSIAIECGPPGCSPGASPKRRTPNSTAFDHPGATLGKTSAMDALARSVQQQAQESGLLAPVPRRTAGDPM